MPTEIRSTVKLEHLIQPFKMWLDTLSELIWVFNHFFYLANDPTRRVKRIAMLSYTTRRITLTTTR